MAIPAAEVADVVPYRQRLEATIEAAEAELRRLDEQEAVEEKLNGDPTRHVITSVANPGGGLGYEIRCSDCGRLGVSGSEQPVWVVEHRRNHL